MWMIKELWASCSNDRLPLRVKAREGMTVSRFLERNPGVPIEALGYKSHLVPRLYAHMSRNNHRRELRKQQKWAARRLDDHFNLKWEGTGPSKTVFIPTELIIPSYRRNRPAQLSPNTRRSGNEDILARHTLRNRTIKLEEQRFNDAMDKYGAEMEREQMNRSRALEAVIESYRKNPTSIFYSGNLKVPRCLPYIPDMTEERFITLTNPAKPSPSIDPRDEYRAAYNGLVAYTPHINEALTALKQAHNDAQAFNRVGNLLITHFRDVAEVLRKLSESGINKGSLSAAGGLGWEWQTMQWAITYLLTQQAMAQSGQNQLPDNMVTLLNCLVEVAELVGVQREDLVVEASRMLPRSDNLAECIQNDDLSLCAPAAEGARIDNSTDITADHSQFQTVILDRSFEEARSEDYMTRRSGFSSAPGGQPASDDELQAMELDQSPEETQAGDYAAGRKFAVNTQPMTNAFGQLLNKGNTLFGTQAQNNFVQPKLNPFSQPSSSSFGKPDNPFLSAIGHSNGPQKQAIYGLSNSSTGFDSLKKSSEQPRPLPIPEKLRSNFDVIGALLHPALKTNFRSETLYIKGVLKARKVPDRGDMMSILLTCRCITTPKKERFFDAAVIVNTNGVNEMLRYIRDLKNDIETKYSWATQNGPVKDLVDDLGKALATLSGDSSTSTQRSFLQSSWNSFGGSSSRTNKFSQDEDMMDTDSAPTQDSIAQSNGAFGTQNRTAFGLPFASTSNSSHTSQNSHINGQFASATTIKAGSIGDTTAPKSPHPGGSLSKSPAMMMSNAQIISLLNSNLMRIGVASCVQKIEEKLKAKQVPNWADMFRLQNAAQYLTQNKDKVWFSVKKSDVSFFSTKVFHMRKVTIPTHGSHAQNKEPFSVLVKELDEVLTVLGSD